MAAGGAVRSSGLSAAIRFDEESRPKMPDLLTDLIAWAIIAGAILYVPALCVLMITYAIWEHRHPSRDFIGPTYRVVRGAEEADRLRATPPKEVARRAEGRGEPPPEQSPANE